MRRIIASSLFGISTINIYNKSILIHNIKYVLYNFIIIHFRLPPNSRVQVTPLARPVTCGVFHARPMPSSVPISMPASSAPDADRWAARIPTHRAEQTRQPEKPGITGHHRASPGISGHIRAYPNISEHIRAYPDISGHIRASSRNQTSSGKKGSSRAVWSVAGHGVGKGRRVPYRPSPDRVSFGRVQQCLSPDRVT